MIRMILLLTFTLLLAHCSDSLTGTENSSETTNGFVAVLLDSNGNPLTSAAAELRTLTPEGDIVDTTISDSLGNVSLEAQPGEEYRLTCISSSNNRANSIGYSLKVKAIEGISKLGEINLYSFRNLKLSSSVIENIQFVIPGTEFNQTILNDTITLSVAPSNDYEILIINSNDTIVRLAPITISGDGLIEVSSVTESGVTFSSTDTLLSDSLIVTNFLKHSEITFTNWDSITDYNSGRIRTLNLSGLNVKTLHKSISDLSFIWNLNLSENPGIELPLEINGLINLELLTMRNCSLTTFPKVEELTTLAQLALENNDIDSIPDSIYKLQNLKSVLLANNSVLYVPDTLYNLPLLETLQLSNNQLTTLSEAVGNLQAIKYLKIDGNKLTGLPSTITGLTNLTEVLVAQNYLSGLDLSIEDWLDIWAEPNWRALQLN